MCLNQIISEVGKLDAVTQFDVQDTQRHCFFRKELPSRHAWILKTDNESDLKELDPGSALIVDAHFTVFRMIHWDHRSASAVRRVRRGILSD